MESIGPHNYEAWLLDRMEGNLTAEQEARLDSFLAAHPHLDPGTGELPEATAPRMALSAAEREALWRSLPPGGPPVEPLDDFLIARMEGDLDAEQLEQLESRLEGDPVQQHLARLYGHARLQAEAASFPDKRSLHRALPPQGMPAPDTLEDFLVARLEGDLRPDQEAALSAYLDKDAHAARAWTLVQQVRIPAGTASYPDKTGLKRSAAVIPIAAAGHPWKVLLRAAAILLLLLGGGIWLILRGPDSTGQLADVPLPAPGVHQHEAPAGEAPEATDPAEDATATALAAEPTAPGMGERPQPQAVPRAATVQQAERMESDAGTTRVVRNVEPLHALAIAPPEAAPLLPLPLAAPGLLADAAPESPVQAMPGATTAAPQQAFSPTELLVASLRSQLLDRPAEPGNPIGARDAVALLDRGLRSVSGGNAGVEVEPVQNSDRSHWKLQLGRHLSISASR
jgi:hypothetical protein